MTAAVWDSNKRGSIFAISKSIDEAGVSVLERSSDVREASELSIDKFSLQVTREFFGRCCSLIWTSYLCTVVAWAKNSVTSVNLGALWQAAQVQLIPSRAQAR